MFIIYTFLFCHMNEVGSVISSFGHVYGSDRSASGRFPAAVDAIGAMLAIRTVEVSKMAMQVQYQDFQRIFDVQA
ncbi:MAG: hypothetical protein HQL31_00325 [Planctomycetes bacterium]|nr:hypothetical protein [Planctomycetota bacterium]